MHLVKWFFAMCTSVKVSRNPLWVASATSYLTGGLSGIENCQSSPRTAARAGKVGEEMKRSSHWLCGAKQGGWRETDRPESHSGRYSTF